MLTFTQTHARALSIGISETPHDRAAVPALADRRGSSHEPSRPRELLAGQPPLHQAVYLQPPASQTLGCQLAKLRQHRAASARTPCRCRCHQGEGSPTPPRACGWARMKIYTGSPSPSRWHTPFTFSALFRRGCLGYAAPRSAELRARSQSRSVSARGMGHRACGHISQQRCIART